MFGHKDTKKKPDNVQYNFVFRAIFRSGEKIQFVNSAETLEEANFDRKETFDALAKAFLDQSDEVIRDMGFRGQDMVWFWVGKVTELSIEGIT